MAKTHKKAGKKRRGTPKSLSIHSKKKSDAKPLLPSRSQPTLEQTDGLPASLGEQKKATSAKVKNAKHKILTQFPAIQVSKVVQDEDETSSSGTDTDSSDGEASLSLAEIAKTSKQDEGEKSERSLNTTKPDDTDGDTPSLTSDNGSDTDNSTNTLQTQVKVASSSSPAKAKLKEAIASHKTSKRATDKLRGDNVLSARSVQIPSVVGGSDAQVLPENASAALIESIGDRKASQTPDLRTKTAKRDLKDEKKSKSGKHRQSTDTAKDCTAQHPRDAVPIPVPKPTYGPPSHTTQVSPEEQKAAVSRIARQYGPDFAARRLTIQPFRTYSSCAFVEEFSDDEPNAAENYKTGKTAAKSEKAQKTVKEPNTKKQRKSTGTGSPRQGCWDDVLAEVRRQRGNIDVWNKLHAENMVRLEAIYGDGKQALEAINSSSSEDTQNASKKRKRDDDNSPEADQQNDHEASAKKIKKNGLTGTTSAEAKCGQHLHIEEPLLTTLQSLIPDTVLTSTLETLKQAEGDRIDNLIKKNQKKEAKQLSKGKVKNAIWQDVDAQMAVDNGFVEETKYSKDDARVLVSAAITLINKISAEKLANALKDGSNARDTSGRRDANNISEVEMQLSVSCMQKDREIQELRAELGTLKTKTDKK